MFSILNDLRIEFIYLFKGLYFIVLTPTRALALHIKLKVYNTKYLKKGDISLV